MLSHTDCTEPAGSPWMCVDGKDTDSWGAAFPVTALSALSWAKVRVPAFGHDPPSASQPGSACRISSGSSLQDIQKLRQS